MRSLFLTYYLAFLGLSQQQECLGAVFVCETSDPCLVTSKQAGSPSDPNPSVGLRSLVLCVRASVTGLGTKGLEHGWGRMGRGQLPSWSGSMWAGPVVSRANVLCRFHLQANFTGREYGREARAAFGSEGTSREGKPFELTVKSLELSLPSVPACEPAATGLH